MNARLDSIQTAVVGTKLGWYDETMKKETIVLNIIMNYLKEIHM